MTQSFDDYQKSDDAICMNNDYNRKIFEAGAQSKQAEIDELQRKYDAMYNAFTCSDDCRKEWHESFMRSKEREDEFRKRIDKVVHILTYTNHASTPLCNELRDILKGTTNE